MSNLEYNSISRFLHRVALQSKVIAEISFDLENSVVKKKDYFQIIMYLFRG
jgi:hypothetical protein